MTPHIFIKKGRSDAPAFLVIHCPVYVNIFLRVKDKTGHILNFPGIDCSDLPKNQQFSGFAPPVILYEASLERVSDGRFIMIWTVQPDCRNCMSDDGFSD